VRRDQAELRSEKREVAHDVAAGRPRAAAGDHRDLRDDRRDLRDDRRDLRDDQRDAARERATLARLEGISGEWSRLQGRMAPPALERKRALLVELTGMARAEVAQDRQEIREDRREKREDQREAAEHRR
jgi:hypothetical protein